MGVKRDPQIELLRQHGKYGFNQHIYHPRGVLIKETDGCNVYYDEKYLKRLPLAASTLLQQVIKQSSMHRKYPELFADVELTWCHVGVFKQRHDTRGESPGMLINRLELEMGLHAFLKAHDQLVWLHNEGNYFHGGISMDTLVLEQHDHRSYVQFTDWSSCHRFDALGETLCVLNKCNYPMLTSEVDPDQAQVELKQMDMDALMFAFNEYGRRSISAANEFITENKHLERRKKKDAHGYPLLAKDGKNLFSQLQRCKAYLDLFGAEFSEQVLPLSPETYTKRKLTHARPLFQQHLTKLKSLHIYETAIKTIREAQAQAQGLPGPDPT